MPQNILTCRKVHWSHAGVKIWELDIIHTSEAFNVQRYAPPRSQDGVAGVTANQERIGPNQN